MPSPDLLEAAGHRAAFLPVPMPPSVDDLSQEVGRRRTKKRRIVGGGAAALALVLAVPLGLSLVGNDQPNLVTLASETSDGDAVGQPATAVQSAETSSTTSAPTLATNTPEGAAATGPFAGMSDENFDLSLNFGDISISIEVITGGDAPERAGAAESSADSARTIDDETIWLDEDGDDVTASALFDGQTFVAVTGPGDDIDRVLDLVTEHANGPVQFFDPTEFADRFDLPEGIFDEDFTFDDEALKGLLDELQDDIKDSIQDAGE